MIDWCLMPTLAVFSYMQATRQTLHD